MSKRSAKQQKQQSSSSEPLETTSAASATASEAANLLNVDRSALYEFRPIDDVKTLHSETMSLRDGKDLFTDMRDTANTTFQLHDVDHWLIDQLLDNEVEVGEMDAREDIPKLPSLSAIDDELNRRRERELGEKATEARDIVNKYRNEQDGAGIELAFRLREEEVASRDRVTVRHQALEARLIDALVQKEGILQKVPNSPFTWTVEWARAPQEFTINVTSLRGLRNKVRPGYYVFLISVYDRVGGRCYRFSTGDSHLDCTAALPPLRYRAKSSAVDLFLDQTVSLSCPSPLLLTTHAVLCVELWQLRVGKYDPTDKVVGFGYFPLVDHNYRVVEGKFKMPLVVGCADEQVDTFRQIGSLIEKGLQYWLGNMYFEVKLTRRHSKVEAAERLGASAVSASPTAASPSVGLTSAGFLGATATNSATMSAAAAASGSFGGTATFGGGGGGGDGTIGGGGGISMFDFEDVTAHNLRKEKTADDVRHLTFPQLPARLFFDDVKIETGALGLPQTVEDKQNFQLQEVSADADSTDLKNMNTAIWQKRAQLEEEKRSLAREDRRRITHALKFNTAEDEQLHEMRIRSELARSKQSQYMQHMMRGAGGKANKHSGDVAEDKAARGTSLLLTKDPLHEIEIEESGHGRAGAGGAGKKKLRDSHVLLDNHHFALVSQREFFFMGRNFLDKQRITASVVLDDVGYNTAGTWDKTKLVTTIIFAILGLYVRLLIHGIGKYLYLGAIDVPITHQSWYPYHIDLRFDFTSRFYPFNSALAAIVPNLVVVGVFIVFGIFFFALVRIFDRLPYWATRLVFWLGVGALLDAPMTVIAESASGNFASGECFLLYNQFLREEQSGIHGAVLTMIFYVTIMIPQTYFMYLYATYVHLNGRAVDVYERITYPENSFFVPCDIEISAAQLQDIVKSAKSDRSDDGTIQLVSVKEFNYKFTCLFKDRLFKLLAVRSNDPEEWISQYINSIPARRPRHAQAKVVDNLGSFSLGDDVLLFMKRHFPTMCSFGDGRLGDRQEDHYYEQDTIVGIATHSTAVEDEKEMRNFLRQYFLAQVSDTKPVEWDDEDPLTFVVKDAQLLADLIFFETDGHFWRLRKLASYLGDNASNLTSAKMDAPETWQNVTLENFDRNEPLTSVQGDDAIGCIMFISAQDVRRNIKQLLRSFVISPFGQVLEPGLPFEGREQNFTFKAKHTADDPEFWAAMSQMEAKEQRRKAEFGLKVN